MNKRVTGNYKVRIQVIRKSFLIDNYVQKKCLFRRQIRIKMQVLKSQDPMNIQKNLKSFFFSVVLSLTEHLSRLRQRTRKFEVTPKSITWFMYNNHRYT